MLCVTGLNVLSGALVSLVLAIAARRERFLVVSVADGLHCSIKLEGA